MPKKKKSSWPVILFFILILLIGAWYFNVFTLVRTVFFAAPKNGTTATTPSPAVSQQASDALHTVTAALTALPKKIGSETLSRVETIVADTIKRNVGEVLSSLPERFGVPGPIIVNETPLSMAFIGRQNQELAFLVKNEYAATSSYAIVWGDGETISGALTASERKIISHTWVAAGVYLMEARIGDEEGKSVRTFSFPLKID